MYMVYIQKKSKILLCYKVCFTENRKYVNGKVQPWNSSNGFVINTPKQKYSVL